MRRLISVIMIVLLLPSVTLTINSCEDNALGVSNMKEKPITYLFAGYDDAGENTDSIILANYSYEKNTISFLQIPRDTYFFDAPGGKINSVFPSERSKGKDQNTSMLAFRKKLEDVLGVNITSHIGYSTKTFSDLVDAIGGVSLYLPMDIEIKNSKGDTVLDLKAGENLLSGEESLMFVRARSEYIRGDLGRVDAQKLFISSFIKKLQVDISVADIFSAVISCKNGWILDAKIGDFFKMLSINRGRLSDIKVNFATIPGEAVADASGKWYYSVSRAPTEKMLTELGFSKTSVFDSNKQLLNKSEDGFVKIYYGNYTTQIYDIDSLLKMQILTR